MKRAALLLLLSLPVQAAWIEDFSPQDLVDQQTRATARFSADMVPLGQPLAAAPFRADCGAVPGSGRWTDTRTWSWQLERPLAPGERCTFTLRSGLKTTGGEGVGGRSQYRFYAPGPWPRQVQPSPGSSIEEDQAFVITPAGAVTAESVERNAWCEADGTANRIPVRLVSEAQRREVLTACTGSPATRSLPPAPSACRPVRR